MNVDETTNGLFRPGIRRGITTLIILGMTHIGTDHHGHGTIAGTMILGIIDAHTTIHHGIIVPITIIVVRIIPTIIARIVLIADVPHTIVHQQERRATDVLLTQVVDTIPLV